MIPFCDSAYVIIFYVAAIGVIVKKRFYVLFMFFGFFLSVQVFGMESKTAPLGLKTMPDDCMICCLLFMDDHTALLKASIKSSELYAFFKNRWPATYLLCLRVDARTKVNMLKVFKEKIFYVHFCKDSIPVRRFPEQSPVRAYVEGDTVITGNQHEVNVPLEILRQGVERSARRDDFFCNNQLRRCIKERFGGVEKNVGGLCIDNKWAPISDKGLQFLEVLENLKVLVIVSMETLGNKGFQSISKLKKLEHLDFVKVSCGDAFTDASMKRIGQLESLRSLKLPHFCNEITDKGVVFLGGLPHLEVLFIKGADNFGLEACEALAEMKNLKSLSLGRCGKIGPRELESLSNMRNLENLSIQGDNCMTDNGMAFLVRLNNLKHFEFDPYSGTKVTSEWFKVLIGLRMLESLVVGGYAKIVDEAMRHISKLPSLKKLKLKKCFLLTDKGFQNLSSIENLQKIILIRLGFGLTDDAMKSVADIESLRSIVIEGASEKVTDRAFEHFAGLENLEVLSVKCHFTATALNVTDAFWEHLSKMKNLRKLSLRGCKKMNSSSLKKIGELTNLESLSLKDFSVEGDDFDFLSKMPKLTKFVFKGCGVMSEKILACVATIKNLEVLKFYQSDTLSDKAVEYLGQLENLRILCLREIDDQVKDELYSKNKNLIIRTSF